MVCAEGTDQPGVKQYTHTHAHPPPTHLDSVTLSNKRQNFHKIGAMSIPGNINTAPPPSSFDNDPDFFEESRWKKFRRRLLEEPLIPIGAAATVWALVEA